MEYRSRRPRVERCGNAGPFHFDVGLSSSHHILRFWGLADESVAFENEATRHVRARLVPAEAEAHGTALACRSRERVCWKHGG